MREVHLIIGKYLLMSIDFAFEHRSGEALHNSVKPEIRIQNKMDT